MSRSENAERSHEQRPARSFRCERSKTGGRRIPPPAADRIAALVASPEDFRYAPGRPTENAARRHEHRASTRVLAAARRPARRTALADAPIVRDLPPGMHVPEGAVARPRVRRRQGDRGLARHPVAGAAGDLRRVLRGRLLGGILRRALCDRRHGDPARHAVRADDCAILPSARAAAHGSTLRSTRPDSSFSSGGSSFRYTIYTDYYREHAYGLSTQAFAPWMGEQFTELGVSLVIGPVVISVVYAGNSPRRSALVDLGDGIRLRLHAAHRHDLSRVHRAAVQRLQAAARRPGARRRAVARARERDSDRARRMVRRVAPDDARSAPTSRASPASRGSISTTTCSNKTSLPEIRAVLAHEMGHYVLNHPFKLTVFLTLIYGLAFALTHRIVRPRAGTLGPAARTCATAAIPPGCRSLPRSSSAPVPAVARSRTRSSAAARRRRMHSVSTPPASRRDSRRPSMRLSTYRKLAPGPIEEFIFYDHPSGYDRVHRAMIWLKENPLNRGGRVPSRFHRPRDMLAAFADGGADVCRRVRCWPPARPLP